MKKDKVFYVYIDWTTEEVPRAFYVGKGTSRRIKDVKRRSVIWNRIKNKYGFNRIIVLATKHEDYAFDIEIKLIYKHKTFIQAWNDGSGWGANQTIGGNGVSGRDGVLNSFYGKHHTDEWKKWRSENFAGPNSVWYGITGPNHPAYGLTGYWLGKQRSDETKRKLSEINMGSNHPRYGKPSPLKGTKSSLETKEKLRLVVTRGSANHLSKLNDAKVIAILLRLKEGASTKDIAKEFNVCRSNIYKIKDSETWTHITRP